MNLRAYIKMFGCDLDRQQIDSKIKYLTRVNILTIKNHINFTSSR